MLITIKVSIRCLYHYLINIQIYQKMNKEEQEKIKYFIKGSRFTRIKKYFWRELYFLEKNHGSIWNRLFWISFFLSILGFAYAVGTVGAMSLFPIGDWTKESTEFQNFNVDFLLKNINHNGNLLIIETEWMQYNFTIYNKYENDVIFKVYTIVSNSGENTYSDSVTEIFVAKGKSENIVKQFPLKQEGIHTVSVFFKMYDVYNTGVDKGKINLVEDPIESKSISKSLRSLSYTDYNALEERAIIYRLLWVVVSPLAAVTVKHIRDLIEGR